MRKESADMVKNLLKERVKPILLTGDNEKAAMNIARQLEITDVKANCLPEDKLSYIEQAQKNGEQICMIGDGINDAPALKMAYVGIAMEGAEATLRLTPRISRLWTTKSGSCRI